MVGLPFSSVQPNTTKSVDYMAQQYKDAIAAYDSMSTKDPSVNARKNAARYRDFLRDDFKESFIKNIVSKI